MEVLKVCFWIVGTGSLVFGLLLAPVPLNNISYSLKS